MGIYLSDYSGTQLDTYMTYAKNLGALHTDDFHTGSSKRCGESGIAGLDSSKILLNENFPVCVQEFNINGNQLYTTGFRDPDMWNIIVSSPTSAAYASRALTLKSGTGAITGARAFVPYTMPLTNKFISATFGYGGCVNGSGGTRKNFIGFASDLSTYPTIQRLGFSHNNTTDVSYIVYGNTSEQSVALSTLPIGRNLQATDYLTIVFDTKENSTLLDVARFYINGIKQYETSAIPTTSVYLGCGTYNLDANVITEGELSINYFGFKRLL